jgi:hypothetical protein
MLTTNGMRFVGAPLLFLYCDEITVLQKENLATHSDTEKSPLRNACPQRDRVWEPAGQLQHQTQRNLYCRKELTMREA